MQRYFLLNAESYFVEGAVRGTIYNCHTGKILALNPQLTKIISKSELGSPLSKIPEYYNYKGMAEDALQKLKQMNYGGYYDSFYKIEKLKPPVTKNSVLDSNMPQITIGFIELTGKCNLNCSFCNAASFRTNRLTGCKRWPAPDGNKTHRELNLNTWKDTIKKMCLSKCRTLYFIGGEPLLKKKEAIELFDYAAKTGVTGIYIFTNATLIDKELITAFKKYSVTPIIQVYSNKEEITDCISGIPGTHSLILRNLDLLRAEGIKFSLALVKLEKYADHYKDVEEFLNSYNPVKIVHSNIFPSKPDNSEFSRQLCKKDPNDIYGGSLSPDQFYLGCERNSCWFQKMAVTANGDVIPCPMARKEIIGNLQTESFYTVLKKEADISKFWNMTRDDIDICKDCEYRYFCKDCRPIEKDTSGGLNKRTRFCLYNPYTGEWGGNNGK